MQDIIHVNESEVGTPESLASLILSGFSRYREEFQRVTTEAKERFAGRDWQGVQRASQRRIKLYRGYAAETAAKLQDLLVDGDQDWAAIRQAYVELAQNRNDAEFASENVALPPGKRNELLHWASSTSFDAAEKSCLELTELYAMDVTAITDEQAEAVKVHYGDAGLVALIQSLGVFYGMTRVSLLWDLPVANT